MAQVLRISCCRQIHWTNHNAAGGLFRARRRLPPSNNEWGPLTDIPDYVIIGKPTPRFTSVGQKRRAINQFNFANEVIRLTSEMKRTQEKYTQEKELEEKIDETLKEKCLRPKGTKGV
ncbi:unnamed protein product [Trichobilharzia szidati]|nr:unnamed protein product [Trichobilharzia szidati]